MRTNVAAESGGSDDIVNFDSLRLRYQQLVEFAPDTHIRTDRLGVILETNRSASSLLGCPKEFLVGKPLGLFIASGIRARFYQSLMRLSSGIESDEFETRIGRGNRLRDAYLRAMVDGPAFRWILRDVTDQRLAETARDELLGRLVSMQEDERRRVARELHDSVGQLLTALLLGLRAVRDSGPLPDAARDQLAHVQSVAEQLGRATHDLAVGLRPTALDDIGLHAALRNQLEEWSALTRIAVHFECVGADTDRFPLDIETTLYRVVQEALTNVARHAMARRVGVVIERSGGRAIAVVEDDGQGFDPDAIAGSKSLGLLGMRERLALVRGSLEIETGLEKGTTLIARIPLPVASPR